jgi:hypothetical protein
VGIQKLVSIPVKRPPQSLVEDILVAVVRELEGREVEMRYLQTNGSSRGMAGIGSGENSCQDIRN